MSLLIPLLVAAALWWLATVVALYRIGMPAASYRRTFVLATFAAVVAVVVLAVSAAVATPASAYAAFASALVIWSWHELSYYLGFVSGPAPSACPEGCNGRERFVRGVRASLYHELAIVVTVLIVLGLTHAAPNKVALWTFCILWLMRWSAKLNIFLGVRNVHMEFLPAHLQYLGSFMARRRMNALFPFSMLAGGAAIAYLLSTVTGPAASPFAVTGGVLLATLLALALVEHVLLMLKVPDGILWRLGTASRRNLPALHD